MEIQIKTTVNFNYIFIEILTFKISGFFWQVCRTVGTHLLYWLECKTVKPIWKIVGSFLQNWIYIYIRSHHSHFKIFTTKKCSHKNLHTNVRSSFICNCQKLETTQMSFSHLKNNATKVYTYNGMLFSNKKKWSISTHNNEDDSKIHYDDYSLDCKISFLWYFGKSKSFWDG